MDIIDSCPASQQLLSIARIRAMASLTERRPTDICVLINACVYQYEKMLMHVVCVGEGGLWMRVRVGAIKCLR